MRLESITVRNYRTHRECSVALDPHRTLIGGPNESGKSTLIEAAHRALFVRATTGGEVQRGMRSHTHGGQPEVEATFEAARKHWRLLKRFSGPSGTATLTEIGGPSWSGDAAEEKLAELLDSEVLSGAGAKKASGQWAHVWVWQGFSGEDPCTHATRHCDDLIAHLQREGGAAAVQSACDRKIAEAVSEQIDKLFTDKREPRAGSPWHDARREEAAAQSALTTAQQTCDRLERAAADFVAAEKDVLAAQQALATVRPQLEECEGKLRRVAELQADVKVQEPAAQIAAREHQTLLADHERIARLRAELENHQSALEPLVLQTEALAQTAQEQHAADELADQAQQRALQAEREARLRRELATAQVQRLEKRRLHAQLSGRLKQVQELRAELTQHRTTLAQIANTPPKKLAALRTLESDLKQAEAARDAMAAGLEVIASPDAVHVGERTLAAGEAAVLTEPTEIQIGASIRLRIRPGGGDSLQEARKRVRATRDQFQRLLDAAGITSVEAAGQAAAQRQQIEALISAVEARLDALQADSLEKEFTAVEEACAAAEADVTRRIEQLPGFVLPLDEPAARNAEREAAESQRRTEAEAVAATVERKRAADQLRAARDALEAHRRTFDTRTQEVATRSTQLQTLIETHGDDAARTSRVQALAVEASKAAAVLAGTRKELEALQPSLLASTRERLTRALAQHTEAEQAARNRRAVAQGELTRDGSTDPHADLAAATERLRTATERRDRAQQDAEAIALLHDLFAEEQKALADRFTQPLAARIGVYLECLYGPGARAEVTYDSEEFSGLRLFRPGHGAGAHEFDQLSGGAREQLAAAVRLALAEVLAQSHDGCLPVVFDDAFAYSDANRVQALQSMLDIAATRGLQIIVLTCNPADYAGLGAKSVTLRLDATARRQATVAPSEDVADDTSPAGSAGPVTAEQRTTFLETLKAAGGKSGNVSLRRELGWNDPTYEAVKAALVAEGAIALGAGKGGSVRLADPES